MLIGILIIGIIFGLFMLMQTMTLNALGGVINSLEPNSISDDAQGAVGFGFIASILVLAGSAFIFTRGSKWLFLVAFLSACMAAYLEFHDMGVYAFVILIVAVSLFVSDRKDKKAQLHTKSVPS